LITSKTASKLDRIANLKGRFGGGSSGGTLQTNGAANYSKKIIIDRTLQEFVRRRPPPRGCNDNVMTTKRYYQELFAKRKITGYLHNAPPGSW
jgi:hypothetical protein